MQKATKLKNEKPFNTEKSLHFFNLNEWNAVETEMSGNASVTHKEVSK